VPAQLRTVVRTGSLLLQQAQRSAAAAAGARVADVGGSTAAAATDPGFFCADRFHPSSAGYAVIAAALTPAVRAAASAALTQRAG
jgi:lysophospholipase L1-like esterase